MKVTYQFLVGADDLRLVARGEIPFVPGLGMDIQVFDGGDLHEVECVVWASTAPDALDVWFKSDADESAAAFYIAQGWKLDLTAEAAGGSDAMANAIDPLPIAVTRMAA